MSTAEIEHYERLYEQTADRVMAFCMRRAGPQAAEDAVAETFAIAWRKRHQLPDEPLPWLFVTARNTILAQRRLQDRQGAIAERVAPLQLLAAESPELGTQYRTEILDALSQLSEDDREAILLIAWDGLTVREAARVLDTTPGALKVRVHRARAKMRANRLEASHD